MRVLDASACVDVLVGSARAAAVASELRGHLLIAPALLDVEVTSALARLERAGALSAEEAGAAIRALEIMPVQRQPHERMIARVWDLRRTLRVADAFYVACAQLAAAPLVTTDARLAGAGLRGTTI